MLILSIVSFVVLFSIIVLIHEWGHYKSALRHGVKVEEFGLGLPPKAKVLRKNKSGTEFTLNWIPFGGFVRMFGEDSQDEADRKKKGSFASVSLLGRIEIVLAGVFMNFILAWGLLIILFTVGTKPIMISEADFEKQIQLGNIVMEESQGVTIARVLDDGIGAKSGFETGDVILKINGEIIDSVQEVIGLQKPSSTINYEIKRGESVLSLTANLDETGKLGTQITDKPLIKEIKNIQMGFFEAVFFSFKECFRISVSTVVMFGDVIGNIFTKGTTPDGVAGPIGIAQMTSVFVSSGDINGLLKFMALISLSLAVINVMPIPALDGGRFLFLLIEGLIRRPVPVTWETYIHLGGYIFLMGLIVLVSIKDVIRLIG